MQPDEILALFDQQERFHVSFPEAQREEVHPDLVRLVEHGEKTGVVIYSKLTADNADASIQEQLAYFRGLDYSVEWKLFDHDTPPDMKARLLEAGFEAQDDEALMILDIETAPKSLFQPSDHDMRRITSTDRIRDVIDLQRIVWEEDDLDFLERRLTHDLEHIPDILSMYVAYVDGIPACSAWIYFSPNSQFASLWGGSTLPEYRKRGLYTAILGVRVREAQARGRRFLYIDASPMSKPIVERHGFVHLSTSRPMEWAPPED